MIRAKGAHATRQTHLISSSWFTNTSRERERGPVLLFGSAVPEGRFVFHCRTEHLNVSQLRNTLTFTFSDLNISTSKALRQWCQTDPVKGHVAAGFHSNQARTHLIQIRCVLAWLDTTALRGQCEALNVSNEPHLIN